MMMRWIVVFLGLLMIAPISSVANVDEFKNGTELPRHIAAIYDSRYEGDPRFTQTHRFLEMPLNHLGYIVDYYDINAPLPELDASYRGITVWFTSGTFIKDPLALFAWLHKALDQHKKLLVMGGLGVSEEFREDDASMKELNRLLHRIGMHDTNEWVNILHNVKVIDSTPELTNFERSYEGEITPYMAMSKVGSSTVSHLRLRAPQYENQYSDLIVTNENGGYISHGYGVYQLYNEEDNLILSQWFINPFLFLKEVLQDSYLPKPDTTTLLGKRIFYSHLDGDGWNNLSEVEKFRKKKTISAEVLYEEVFKPYEDFAFTVAPIIAELRPDCYGIPDSIPVAENIFKLYNVEPGSHSYSHPLYWGFFADGDNEKEKPLLKLYPEKPMQRFFLSKWLLGKQPSPIEERHDFKPYQKPDHDPMIGIRDPVHDPNDMVEKFDTPRSYACEPYNLDKEVRGSVEFIEKLTGGKKVKLFQWSGNTSPYEAAIHATRELGLYNINGGDTRFDTEYPSYATVAPLSAPVGKERQIYSSNSNENTYTNLWTDRFFGFKYLQTTVNNTEVPIRVAPYNLYFHSYSGEKDAALMAVKENLEYARRQNLISIFASEFAAIVEGFFTTEIIQLGHDQWKILNRGGLQTIRIDNATLRAVDFQASKGVLGQTHYQGSLYIALDDTEREPVIKLKSVDKSGGYETAKNPYIIESNWKIKGLQFGKNSLSFAAAGFGKSDILLQMPDSSEVKIQLHDGEKVYEERTAEVDVYNRLRLVIDNIKRPVGVSILVDRK